MSLEVIRHCKFNAAFSGELNICRAVDGWDGLELFIVDQLEGCPEGQSDVLGELNNPDSWYGDPPIKFHYGIGETCSLTVFRASKVNQK